MAERTAAIRCNNAVTDYNNFDTDKGQERDRPTMRERERDQHWQHQHQHEPTFRVFVSKLSLRLYWNVVKRKQYFLLFYIIIGIVQEIVQVESMSEFKICRWDHCWKSRRQNSRRFEVHRRDKLRLEFKSPNWRIHDIVLIQFSKHLIPLRKWKWCIVSILKH